MEVVQLTESAISKAQEMLERQRVSKPEAAQAGLGIGIRGGGCSGLAYELRFRLPTEDDFIYEYPNGLRVFVDPKSAALLQGSTVEWYEGLDRSGFEVQNPNATGGCGCGKSFSS